MFALHKIKVSNFRSFKGTHTFEFPTTDGLYFFTGRNDLDKSLGANGAGKSTFLDAITWVLYGRTTRGLKASDILTWELEASCKVELELTVGENRYVIKRTQKPNGLFIDDKPVDQEELEKHTRLNFTSFLYSVLTPQFGESFFSLQPGAKLTLFSEIMRLDYWLTKADAAATQTKEIDGAMAATTGGIARFKGQVDGIDHDLESLKARENKFERDQEVKIAELEAELKNFVDDDFVLKSDIKLLRNKREKAVLHLQKAAADQTSAQLSLEQHLASMNKQTQQIARIEQGIADLNDKLSKFEKFGNAGFCVACEQPVDEKHRRSHLSAVKLALRESTDRLKAAKELHADMMKDVVRCRGKIGEYQGKREEFDDEVRKFTRDIDRLQVRLESALEQKDKLNAQIKKAEQEPNPYSAMIKEKREQKAAAEGHLKKLQDQLETLTAQYEATSYWVKGFKRIRLFIIEQAFKTLEVEVNNCLAQLGMPNWQITFDVERENKSGGVTKGFSVFITGPQNKQPVRWESWSGGETQRLQLAGTLGLSNLIMQQAGLRNQNEFYDEPSTHLSPEGMMDLANVLHERAVSEGKRIWIVDHAAITNFGDFESIITVRKDQNGSRIEST